MKVLLIFLLFVVHPTRTTAICDNNECKVCLAMEGCSFAVQVDGKGSCVREEDLEKLTLKKVLFKEGDCIKFYSKVKSEINKAIESIKTDGRKNDAGQGQSKLPRSTGIKSAHPQPRSPVNLTRSSITAGVKRTYLSSAPTIYERQFVSPPVSAIQKRGNQTLEIKDSTKLNSFSVPIGYNCETYRRDNEDERLNRTLCRAYELIVKKGKFGSLDRDLLVMNLLNPMRMKVDECKMLQWRKVKCSEGRT